MCRDFAIGHRIRTVQRLSKQKQNFRPHLMKLSLSDGAYIILVLPELVTKLPAVSGVFSVPSDAMVKMGREWKKKLFSADMRRSPLQKWLFYA